MNQTVIDIDAVIANLINVALAVPFIGSKLSGRQKDSAEATERLSRAVAGERRDASRVQRNRLTMELTLTCVDLAIATAEAVRDAHPDIELDEVIAESKKSRDEYFRFLNDIAAEQLAKEGR